MIVFVAIKNGQHDPRCFVMKTDNIDNIFKAKNKNITYINGKWQDINFWGNELTLHEADHALPNERHHVDMGQVCVPHFGIHLTRDVFDSIKEKIETHDEFKYLDEPYLRFKDDEQEQETFFIKDPSGNVIEIKTMRTPELLWADNS